MRDLGIELLGCKFGVCVSWDKCQAEDTLADRLAQHSGSAAGEMVVLSERMSYRVALWLCVRKCMSSFYVSGKQVCYL